MRKLLGLLTALALAGCASVGTLHQTLYQGFATYTIAEKQAAIYAEGPTADAAIVHRINLINQNPETKATVAFVKAYVLCAGSNSTEVAGVDCRLFDFSSGKVSAVASSLRSVIAAIAIKGK